jgi:hypothetical protein
VSSYYFTEYELGPQHERAVNLGQWWARILDLALQPGGVDEWAVILPDPHRMRVVQLRPKDAEPASIPLVVPVMQIGVGVNRILRGEAGVSERTVEVVRAARQSYTTHGMTPRMAAEVVQAELFGEVRYRWAI